MTNSIAQTRDPIDARAERILAAALDEFARRGFADARESVIARHAGVSFAALRRHFTSKRELFREVIRSTVVQSLRKSDQTWPAETALFRAPEVIGRFGTRLEQTLADGAARGVLRVANPRTAARVILPALMTHAHWFAFPGICRGMSGADRARAEATVLDVLVEVLRIRPRSDPLPGYEPGLAKST